MQCKDIPDGPILAFLAKVERGETAWTPAADMVAGWGAGPFRYSSATWFGDEFENSVTRAMPPRTPPKLVLAKMRQLIRRGVADGCGCGCRGDFGLTDKGRSVLAGELEPTSCDNPPTAKPHRTRAST
jgi:hypothetical protein